MIYVDIIDSSCTVRRKNIKARAEQKMATIVGERDRWVVRDFRDVDDWKTETKDIVSKDVHILFLHAPGQHGWDDVVRFFAKNYRQGVAGRLVTYTGSRTYELMPVGKINQKEVQWWDNYTGVFGQHDYPKGRKDALRVGTIHPPVEDTLSKVLDERSSASMRGEDDENVDFLSSVQSGPSIDLRHMFINAVSPLRTAILYSTASGNELKNFPILWQKLKEKLSTSGKHLENWILESVSSLDKLAETIREGDTSNNRSTLEIFLTELSRIENYATFDNQQKLDWKNLAKVFAESGQRKIKILWLDDDESWFLSLGPLFTACGFDVTFHSDVDRFLLKPNEVENYDAVLLDLAFDDLGYKINGALEENPEHSFTTIYDQNAGIGLLQLFQEEVAFPPPIYILSANESADLISACTRFGAAGYFTKERTDYAVFFTNLLQGVRNYRQIRESVIQPRNPKLIVGTKEDPLTEIILRVTKMVDRGVPGAIILIGEPGVGKEELAREIHLRSERRGKFFTVDCSALPSTLVEAELLGHARGAFTDARKEREGAFEIAHNGTIFIDEVDKIDVSLQNNLLGPLERRTVRRIGENREREIDVLVILASNTDPHHAALDGAFSQPLVSRITYKVNVPSLRERSQTLEKLANGLCRQLCEQNKWKQVSLTPEAVKWLRERVRSGKFSGIRGNIRGLRNMLIRAITYFPDETKIEPIHLRSVMQEDEQPISNSLEEEFVFEEVAQALAIHLERVDGPIDLDDVEKRIRAGLFKALEERMPNKKIAALFGIKMDNLRQKRLELRKKGFLSKDA